MSSNNLTPPSPPRVPPHIRLNSGHEDLAANTDVGHGSRSLVPQGSRPSSSLSGDLRHSVGGQHSAGFDSSVQLLPPTGSRPYSSRSPSHSPGPSARPSSGYSSRRSSFDSDSPFRDSSQSRPGSRADSDDLDVNTQTVSEKYNILPSAGLLLYPEDVENDDYLHNPDPGGEVRECNIFNRRALVNIVGLGLLCLGLLATFIAYPIINNVTKYTSSSDPCSDNSLCVTGDIALLQNVRTSLVDPDTPTSAKTKKDYHGNTWKLVFSDEFTTEGRTFYDGDDPYWQAVDIWYGVTEDLEWYDPDAVTTADGVLELRFDAFQNHDLNYRSGMLQSWNKMCFKQGRLEASISLPGAGNTIGFWPGFWAMGNLGRPGYQSTTDGMWPYSYENTCDVGITPNQSSPDGLNWLPGMRLPSCTCAGGDHPNRGTSRSSPEIDVIEASVTTLDSLGNKVGVVSQSYQAAPFDIWYQPNYDFVELYDPTVTTMNSYKGGVYQQAISGLTNVNNDWYDGNAYQVYAFEYTPGTDGDIVWFVGDDASWRLHANALAANGNVARRIIPEEPMSIIVNFGMSTSFASLNLTGLASLMPATMRVDYIRIYQDDDGEVTCDPDGYPTTTYISDHPKAYKNPNMTTWDDAGYTRPNNSFVDGC